MVLGQGSRARCRSAPRACSEAAYLGIGQPERWVECVPRPARTRSRHSLVTRAILVIALAAIGCQDEAMVAAAGLIEAAEATRNPFVLSMHFSPTATPSATPIPSAH